MKIPVVCLIFVALACQGAWSADAPKQLTLAECLEIAAQKHPDLVAARSLIDSARAQMRAARSGYRPHLDLGTSYSRQTYNYTPAPGTSARASSTIRP